MTVKSRAVVVFIFVTPTPQPVVPTLLQPKRFDSWVRGLTTARSRRSALVGLIGGGLGLLSFGESEAKKHKMKKGKEGRRVTPRVPTAGVAGMCAGAAGDDLCRALGDVDQHLWPSGAVSGLLGLAAMLAEWQLRDAVHRGLP